MKNHILALCNGMVTILMLFALQFLIMSHMLLLCQLHSRIMCCAGVSSPFTFDYGENRIFPLLKYVCFTGVFFTLHLLQFFHFSFFTSVKIIFTKINESVGIHCYYPNDLSWQMSSCTYFTLFHMQSCCKICHS